MGYARQDVEQKKDMGITFYGVRDYKKLDYIACWFYIASLYIQNANGKAQNLVEDTYSEARSVYVSGGNLYVAGYEHNAKNESVAKLWINGVTQNISNGTHANSVFVVE